MQPAAARSTRLSVPPPAIPSTPAYIPQRVIYAPVTTIQSCARTLPPNCIYSAQGNVAPTEVADKSNACQMKIRLLRNQYCQQQLYHPPNPVVLCKQSVGFPRPPLPLSNSSFLVSSPAFAPDPTILPQPYYPKPSELRNLHLMQERQILPQHHQYQQQQMNPPPFALPPANSPIATSFCFSSHLQSSNFFPYRTVAYMNNQAPLAANITTFPNVSLGPIIGAPLSEKHPSRSRSAISTATKFSSLPLPNDVNLGNQWHSQDAKIFSAGLYGSLLNEKSQEVEGTSESNAQDERLSEASSTSFDFTIEAEKMVSALCDTKTCSNFPKDEGDLGKKGNDNEDGEEEKEDWFVDLCADFGSCRSMATQTQERWSERKQHPAVIRKTIYGGCTEAEQILKTSRYQNDQKYKRLASLSSATKIAVTKSSNCCPVFGGNQVFVHDLMSALLRISNGWLILDNYLNKQFHPTLADKWDSELIRNFQLWENNTNELLKSVTQTFSRLEKNSRPDLKNLERKQVAVEISCPGDVSLYTNNSLFHSPTLDNSFSISDATSSYFSQQTLNIQNFRYSNCNQLNQKESKLRSKWTISENATAGSESSKPSFEIVDSSRKSRKKSNGAVSKQSLDTELFNLQSKMVECSGFGMEQGQDFPTSSESSKLKKALLGNTNANNAQKSIFQSSKSTQIPTTSDGKRDSNLDATGKLPSNEIQLLPKDEVTLLSQIEPASNQPRKMLDPRKMTANLSAFFASMRNSSMSATQFAEAHRSSQRYSKNAIDFATAQLQMNADQQLLSIRNMQSIQSAPWNAGNLLSGNKTSTKTRPDDCDSSEDMRVYMKPGSYNVPKKRHQKRSNRRVGCSSLSRNGKKTAKEHSSLLMSPTSSVEQSSCSISFPPTPILGLFEVSEKTLQENDLGAEEIGPEDVTWKAACASAEILLEALTVKRRGSSLEELFRKQTFSFDDKLFPGGIVDKHRLSEDSNSGDEPSFTEDTKQSRSNVKTDSWLLQTLNNAVKVDEQENVKLVEQSRASYSDMIRCRSTNSSLLDYNDKKLETNKAPARNQNDFTMLPQNCGSKPRKVITKTTKSQKPKILGNEVKDTSKMSSEDQMEKPEFERSGTME